MDKPVDCQEYVNKEQENLEENMSRYSQFSIVKEYVSHVSFEIEDMFFTKHLSQNELGYRPLLRHPAHQKLLQVIEILCLALSPIGLASSSIQRHQRGQEPKRVCLPHLHQLDPCRSRMSRSQQTSPSLSPRAISTEMKKLQHIWQHELPRGVS